MNATSLIGYSNLESASDDGIALSLQTILTFMMRRWGLITALVLMNVVP